MTKTHFDKSALITMKCEIEVIVSHLQQIAKQTHDAEWYWVSADATVATTKCLKMLQWIEGELKI